MVFTNQDFIDMLNFFKDKNCFSKNAKESFESITEISKSESGKSLIKSNHCLYNLDILKDNNHGNLFSINLIVFVPYKCFPILCNFLLKMCIYSEAN